MSRRQLLEFSVIIVLSREFLELEFAQFEITEVETT